MAFHVQLCLLRNTYEPIPAIPTQFIGPRCVICYLIHRKKSNIQDGRNSIFTTALKLHSLLLQSTAMVFLIQYLTKIVPNFMLPLLALQFYVFPGDDPIHDSFLTEQAAK